MKEWALKYAEMGLYVLPLIPGQKEPATANGFRDASNDKAQAEKWWTKCPDYNIGIATGIEYGSLVVIDLDRNHKSGEDGYETLKEWQRENGGELPETWTSITGQGGYHLIYIDDEPHGSRRGLYEGVDIRGEGAYIVAPPSIHPDTSRRYEWEQGPGECKVAWADTLVKNFLLGPMTPDGEKQAFSLPETIPEGGRTDTMIKLIGSLRGKGLSDEAIMAAVSAENEARCVPPLTDKELEKTVFSALKRGWKVERPYTAGKDKGNTQTQTNHSLEMVTMDRAEEKAPEWLGTDYIPRYQITSLAGDGGSGKTTVWCSLAADISNGRRTFLESFLPDGFGGGTPQKVMFFSAEDSFEYTLKRRLRKNGANLANIFSIDIADDRFQDIKFNSVFLERLIEKHRPALCIFDPIQAFVPPDIRMGDRNAMRSCMAPLIGHGEKYGVTFLIVEHANKQSGVWGRKRIADSADIWDISRSVIMAGETNEPGIRYLAHEKSNYGRTGSTILYAIEDEVIQFKGYTQKKDKDFVVETDYTTRQAPQREEAKEFILDFLKDGEKEVAELDEMAAAMSISKNAMKNAKAELKKDRRTKTWSIGYGPNKKFFIRLVDGSPIASEKTNE